MVRKLSLAIVFMGTLVIGFTAFAAPVSATTCSGRYKTCLQVCPHGKRAPMHVLGFYQIASGPDAGIA